MDMSTSIAAASMNMNAAKLQQSVGIAVMGKVMDVQEQAAAELISQLASGGSPAASPPSQNLIDVYA